MVQWFEDISAASGTMLTTPDYVTDCVIVGTGPSGGSLASFLGSYGIKGVIIGKTSTTAQTPRAHITNMATMECMRDIGIEQECRNSGLDWSYMTHVHWSESMAGKEYARLPSWGNGPSQTRYKDASPCPPMDLAQTLLEPILIQKAAASGFIVRFDTEFLSFSEENTRDLVQVKVRDLVFERNFTIHFAVGKGAGVQAWDLLVRADLSHLMHFRQGSLHWTFQDDCVCPGSLLVVHPRMYKPWTEWVVGFSWAPGSEPDTNIAPTHDDWIKRLKTMIGDESVKLEILDIVKWEMDNAVAERSSQGRVFCLGDAVHRHGPGGALGSNTAIQDAFNLAWKVAYVLKGQAGPSLLDTYSVERYQVGAEAASSSMDAVLANFAIIEALGARGATGVERMKDQQKGLSENTKEGKILRQKLRKALEESKFGIEGLGNEMNQQYKSSAVWVQNNDELKEPELLNSRLNYFKNTYPGTRLPHAWLNTIIPSKPISTIDLAGHGRFTIFTGIGGEKWKTSAARVKSTLGLCIAVFSIGHGQDYEDPYFEWESCREVDESGAILVRPDRFIAWRSTNVEADCEATLLAVFRKILSL